MAGTALDAREREEIRVGLVAEESFTDIARGLLRATSTISREVKRNGGRDGYCAVTAEDRCVSKRKRWRLTKLEANEALCGHVEARLAALDSPTTIAVELAVMGGIDGTTVSAETIYLAVYAQGAKGPRGSVRGSDDTCTTNGDVPEALSTRPVCRQGQPSRTVQAHQRTARDRRATH